MAVGKLFTAIVCLGLGMALGTELQIEYYEPAHIDCDHTAYNFTSDKTIMEQYWLLPNGNIIQSSSNKSDNHIVMYQNFSITINKISDQDFGYYYCLLVRSDYSVDRIVHGLNTDGPYYGDLLKKYTHKAMIGGIAAGTLFVVLAGCCVVWQFHYHRRARRNEAVDELDKTINGYDLKAYDNVGLEVEANGEAPLSVAAQGVNEKTEDDKF
ncbi:hypothetical protein MAR_022257 [Mya arenaria]|uniref:Ig-like domain-containing protein n=1 Tax=Mya arenaria TaxID=6604 RepID=A0ABY7DKK5_MYAAR|nr:uncharacterized protein LOC128228423 [Mya arenaria]WAQ97884.1 hypothetical protein MAR_022257 [Mya arenaria]